MNSSKENLSEFPPIFYINLDKNICRRNFMEKQFQKFGIKNHTRISADRFSPEKFDSWKNNILVPESLFPYILKSVKRSELSLTLNVLSTIVGWYDSDSSQYCVIAEDDLSFGVSKYWNFTWKFFVENLPKDWECVQLHVISDSSISMGLSRRVPTNYSAACVLINRNYAEKLKEKFYFKGKYKLYSPGNYDVLADVILYQIGVTYSFPLFATNYSFPSNIRDGHNTISAKSDYKTVMWWKNESKNYLIENLLDLDYKKPNLDIQI